MAGSTVHISISAETLFSLGTLEISNSMMTSVVVSVLLIAVAFIARTKLQSGHKPEGLQNVMEWIVESLYNLVHSVTDDHKKSKSFFPLIATFFIFILFNNFVSLLPGVGTIGVLREENESHVYLQPSNLELPSQTAYAATDDKTAATAEEIINEALESDAAGTVADPNQTEEPSTTFIPFIRPGTADLNTTLALALISVIITQVIGVSHLGLGYFSKFINFSNPVKFFVGILETISEFAKIISFAFRLFGNIFAGEVLLAVITFLVPLVAPMPFYGLEVFVGFIQALVFAMLSAVFFNMATQSHDEH